MSGIDLLMSLSARKQIRVFLRVLLSTLITLLMNVFMHFDICECELIILLLKGDSRNVVPHKLGKLRETDFF